MTLAEVQAAIAVAGVVFSVGAAWGVSRNQVRGIKCKVDALARELHDDRGRLDVVCPAECRASRAGCAASRDKNLGQVVRRQNILEGAIEKIQGHLASHGKVLVRVDTTLTHLTAKFDSFAEERRTHAD